MKIKAFLLTMLVFVASIGFSQITLTIEVPDDCYLEVVGQITCNDTTGYILFQQVDSTHYESVVPDAYVPFGLIAVYLEGPGCNADNDPVIIYVNQYVQGDTTINVRVEELFLDKQLVAVYDLIGRPSALIFDNILVLCYSDGTRKKVCITR